MNVKRFAAWLGGTLCAVSFATVNAGPIVPDAADWSVGITTVTDRGSPAATTSITDITDGVLLEYDAATGGFGVGTTTNQYDFTTSAAATGTLMLEFDLQVDAFIGFFGNEFELHVLQNDGIVQTLVPFTSVEPGVNLVFEDVMLSLGLGDTWGVRVIAGNFDSGSGVSGNIAVTAVPVPATIALLGLGLLGLVGQRREALTG